MTKAILLTRPLNMNAEDQIRFRAQGFGRFYEIPLCEIKPLPITEAIKRKINAAEWLFFTSQAPVASVLAVIEKGHHPLIAVIGKKTGKMVQSCGFKVAFVSPEETKKQFVSAWQERFPSGTSIFYPKSQLADDYIEELLGIENDVTGSVLYQNIFPDERKAELVELLNWGNLSAVYFASPSAWKRFLSVYNKTEKMPFVFYAIGDTTKKSINDSGYQAVLVRR
ncbi:uroporphyrinogen-III synthase [Trichococcus collinsii]|uniref:Uroporphyrinogen-III synthase n=1 Tax=Trichococcus collinsii TaxID=157076 RepID=A0AB37ZWW7_9LACT|nr:uroporphyrinogen-III synthase [Trichococcus collinsii]CZQ81622.1 tetrapyrrole biosynthesis uroporphyrinogen iii synthase [Trichococcus collinsii]SDZ89424.1 Uroporphyrinogen-III synthase HemD [Trichococcus collinsii]